MNREPATINQATTPAKKASKRVSKRVSKKAVVALPATNIMQVIERAALNPDVQIDKMERLLEMKERIDAKEAEQRFNAAMVLAQHEMGPISTDCVNDQTHSRYASYAHLDKALRPIYTSHGFSLSFDTEECGRELTLRVVCYVGHADGHSRKHTIDMPADGKGAKGGNVMTLTHATGSASAYGMRYLLKMIFNVAVGEEDDDGQSASAAEYISGEQVANIYALLNEHNIDVDRFLVWLGGPPVKATAIDAIYPNAYDAVIGRINSAIRAEEKPEAGE